MPEPAVLLVTALPEEQRAVERVLRASPGWRGGAGAPRGAQGELDGRPVRLASTGVGARRAFDGVSDALRGQPQVGQRPTVLGVGIAGALSPDLQLGELVWSARVVSGEGRLVAELPVPAPVGTLVSAAGLVNGAREREELWRAVGRPDRAAVDLESFAWARAAEEAGSRWLIVRAISDTPGQPLPEAVVEACADDGSIDRGRLARGALRRPGQFLELVRLERVARRAADGAARAAVSWLGGEGAPVG